MPKPSSEPENPWRPPSASKVYHAGTLVYTKAALAVLLCWLLWGDFCYTLMEAVTGPIMQLRFQSLHASNTEVGLIIGTIPGLVYSFLNPIISFRSDRFRSPMGRRIPFILVSLPFLVLGLVGLGYGDRIAFWLHDHLPFLRAVPANQFAIMVLGALLVGFTFFNTFVTSTFWYLFNDVVPEHLLARFMAWFRTVSTLSAALYSFFIFPHSATHSKEIFLGAALLYLLGFGLMCYNVKEGEYPPPPPYIDGQTGPVAAIKTYAAETHAFPHYWYLWLNTFIGGIGASTVLFSLYFMESIGLNLQQIGIKDGTNMVIVSVLTLGAGWLADRFHPIRVCIAGATMSLLLVTPANMVWIFWHPAPKVAFLVVMTIVICLSAPATSLLGMWDPPMLMRLFPRSQYGQFCSINGVWRMMGGLCGGLLTGGYLDILARYVGKERAYSFLPCWSICFSIPSYVLLHKLYRSWKKHGGDDAYVAPTLEAISIGTALVPPVQEVSL
jgi:hypothetical protein